MSGISMVSSICMFWHLYYWHIYKDSKLENNGYPIQVRFLNGSFAYKLLLDKHFEIKMLLVQLV